MIAPSRRLPTAGRVLTASVLALAASLGVDVVLVTIGKTAFPATRNYGHFHFSDYGSLTVLGVVLACAAWMVVTRASSDPRRLFFRVAVIVTLVLWLPDVWLLIRDQPFSAVAILMSMHLGIALVTYYALVVVAPAGEPPGRRQVRASGHHLETASREGGASPSALEVATKAIRLGKWVWILMMIGVGVELVAGIVALVVVPVRRPDGWLPGQGETAYLIHAGLGGVLTLAAMFLVVAAPRGRMTPRRHTDRVGGPCAGRGRWHPGRLSPLPDSRIGADAGRYGGGLLRVPDSARRTGAASGNGIAGVPARRPGPRSAGGETVVDRVDGPGHRPGVR